MIASVRGTVLARRSDHVVVECAGVGYRLAVSAETLGSVPPTGQETSLHAHLVMREDGIHLYGFAAEEERELFLMLIGVPSVGPKLALTVLSGGTVRELLNAIGAGDITRFQAVPGIGRRTAERILVELREKVGDMVLDEIAITRGDDPRGVAREGLIGLGYAPAEADSLLSQAAGDSPQELIATALRAAR